MDRRQHPRIPYGAWIEDLTREGSIQFYLAKDLSLGGVLLEAATPPEVGNMVHLRLIIENESKVMAVDGQVVRHAAAEGGRKAFAVRFMNMDEARQTFIEEVIKECAQAGTPPSAPSAPPDRNVDDDL